MSFARTRLPVHPLKLATLLTLALVISSCGSTPPPTSTNAESHTLGKLSMKSSYQYKRVSNPARTIVTDASGTWVATFTDNARTVVVAGAKRTFAEPATTARTVTHDRWVRLLGTPFTGTVDEAWLNAARADASPDVLAVAVQYVDGAPNLVDASGLRYAGDADYGPLLADGTRQEGSDFNDYLGLDWQYPDKLDYNEAHQFGSLDCSGFTRMVFGYRGTLPLSLNVDPTALPRRAWMQYEQAAGTIIIKNAGTKATAYDRLHQGDLVFFDASTDDGTAIDHVGIYLGVDDAGNHRFISSRKSANGPTLGDYKGRSVLNPVNGRDGLYSKSFRSARRP